MVFEVLLVLAMIAVVIKAFCAIAEIRRELDEMQPVQTISGIVVSAESFLPDGFDPNSPAYRAALKRYDIEQGDVFPNLGNKKAAPGKGTPETTSDIDN